MASHHLQEVEQLCARVYLLDGGRCRAHGTLDELLATDERQIVLRGLDDAGLERVLRAVRDAGGEVVLSGRRREHLFALFRRFER
jgi:ABC-type multidrug transport system ATPase subunit